MQAILKPALRVLIDKALETVKQEALSETEIILVSDYKTLGKMSETIALTREEMLVFLKIVERASKQWLQN